ncbi:hypothetical protein ACLEPN_00720 [Myxococcus sp. 1LA]
MTGIRASAFAWVNGQRHLAKELLDDASLRARAHLDDDPIGGVEIADDGASVLIDDSIKFASEGVLGDGPARLRAREPLVYPLRLSHGSFAIVIKDGNARIGDMAGSNVSAPVEEMIAALEAGYAEYRALLAAAAAD